MVMRNSGIGRAASSLIVKVLVTRMSIPEIGLVLGTIIGSHTHHGLILTPNSKNLFWVNGVHHLQLMSVPIVVPRLTRFMLLLRRY